MKLNLPLIVLSLMILAACDAPRSQRAHTASSGMNANGINFNPSPIPAGTTNGSNSPSTTNGTSSSGVTIPSDATQCKFASDGISGFESNSAHLGEYTLCQSSTDKSVVYFQLKTPPTNAQGNVSICFIPTTNNGSSSIYVGNPMCGYFTDAKQIRKIQFIKYPAYANATITGVLFFKDLSWYYPVFNQYMMTLDAYKTCMNMLAYGNTAYCESFKSVGQYIYKQF